MPEGKIIKALSGFYYVYDNGEMITCRGRGVFRNRGESPLVGDIVDYKVEGDSLSFPDIYGEVERPFYVKVEAQDRDGALYELEAEDYEARVILHEIEHLHGVLFTSKIIRYVDLEEVEKELEMSSLIVVLAE